MAKKSNTLLIGGLALAAAGVYWYMNQTPTLAASQAAALVPPPPGPGLSNPQLSYLQQYAAGIANPNYTTMVNNINVTDQNILYTIVHDYFATGQTLTPGLLAQWQRFTQTWALT